MQFRQHLMVWVACACPIPKIAFWNLKNNRTKFHDDITKLKTVHCTHTPRLCKSLQDKQLPWNFVSTMSRHEFPFTVDIFHYFGTPFVQGSSLTVYKHAHTHTHGLQYIDSHYFIYTLNWIQMPLTLEINFSPLQMDTRTCTHNHYTCETEIVIFDNVISAATAEFEFYP